MGPVINVIMLEIQKSKLAALKISNFIKACKASKHLDDFFFKETRKKTYFLELSNSIRQEWYYIKRISFQSVILSPDHIVSTPPVSR